MKRRESPKSAKEKAEEKEEDKKKGTPFKSETSLPFIFFISIIIFIFSYALFFNCLDNDFVYDDVYIRDNKDINSEKTSIWEIFKNDWQVPKRKKKCNEKNPLK